ncbi:MAG: methyltransferase type 11 [Methanoculleus sp. SDB]|nr:MAG: methyltransferase type 11 [Methanoculleus sp. SDB]
MPGICFRMMTTMFWLRDRIRPPERILDTMGIREGMCIVDYGCGPGSYLRGASELVGERGRVYAVDIHELAIASVAKRIEKEGLGNVTPMLAKGYDSGLPEGVADLIYALDMFFMIDDQGAFLAELRRIAAPDAVLIIDDGHQPRERTRNSILSSPDWVIEEERTEFLLCRPARCECSAVYARKRN